MPEVQSHVRSHLNVDDCLLSDLVEIVEEQTDPADYPHAARVDHNVVVYDSAAVRAELSTPTGRLSVFDELLRALSSGPGIVVFAGAVDDTDVVDRVTEQFEAVIAEEHAAGGAAGDHFAKSGENDRIWNAAQKLALRAPAAFVHYYSNALIAAVCQAWLGPGYQLTSQVNVVKPGGAAQTVHRDYHLGFLPDDAAAQFPTHVHQLSPMLTLQGAVAHTDMPVETGPTKYLPHSQKYLPGYLAWRRPEFAAYFEDNYVQLPLAKGDAVFFNPALFHAAGHNRTADTRRIANLLQVSSAFGRAMEAMDRRRMVSSIYPALLAMKRAGASESAISNVIAAAAEGYAFPTDLDRDSPVEGLAPKTQAELVVGAVTESWTPEQLDVQLDAWAERRRP